MEHSNEELNCGDTQVPAWIDGMELNNLGDALFGAEITGVQVGFCYELLRQIEPVLTKH